MNLMKIMTGVVVIGGLFMSQFSTVFALSANISRSYHSKSNIPAGSLVSLDTKKSNFVSLAEPLNQSSLVGVSVAGDESLLAVGVSTDTIQIASSGTAIVLVSDANGDIEIGDQIAVSPFKGIGMKAEPGNRIVGVSQMAFSKKSKGSVTREITSTSGKKLPVTLGNINVTVAIGTANNNVNKTRGLQRVAQDIVGHPISIARVILGGAIAVIALVAIVTLIYGSIFGSIIAIGRNPLAKQNILKSLASVIFMVIAMAAMALGTIFLFVR